MGPTGLIRPGRVTVDAAINAQERERLCAEEFAELLARHRCKLLAVPRLVPVTLPSGEIVHAMSTTVGFTAQP